MVWEHYRFLLGYRAMKSLYPPYEIRSVEPVAGRGSWNVDKGIFRAVVLSAGSESVEIAVPEIDLEFLQYAVSWINGSGA
jgi:hypothetical protein